MILLLLFGELTILYVLAGALTQAGFELLIRITRSRTIAVTVVTLIVFPGTVIHELSHLFTAEILGVKTGKLSLVPENIREDEIKAGSVMIAHSDPFRRYLIGLAPIVVGMVTVTALSYMLSLYWGNWGVWGNMGGIYLLLSVSNSMFSSREDMKGFIPFAITLAIMIAAAYVAGLRIGLTGTALSLTITILDALTKSLGLVLGINIAGLFLIKLGIRIIRK